jgi:hypothetical protein
VDPVPSERPGAAISEGYETTDDPPDQASPTHPPPSSPRGGGYPPPSSAASPTLIKLAGGLARERATWDALDRFEVAITEDERDADDRVAVLEGENARVKEALREALALLRERELAREDDRFRAALERLEKLT